MWCGGAVRNVGVSLVMSLWGRVPSVLGTLKLEIILWDLEHYGHFCRQSEHFLALSNLWVNICKNMCLGGTVGIEVIKIGDLRSCPIMSLIFVNSAFSCLWMCSEYLFCCLWELKVLWLGKSFARTCHQLTSGLKEREKSERSDSQWPTE
jgi:hypothetical protein